MKLKNYFLLLTMLTFPSLFFGQITLTQSTSNTITPNNSVSCNSDAPNYTTYDNIYYRAFDLNSLGYASGFHVAQVSFGIEEVSNEPVGFAVDVIIYETDSFPGGTLNMVSTVSVPLTSTNTETIVNIPMSANVNSRYLVYAISVPDQVALGNTTRFFIGSNTLGQSSPSYVSSNNCTITTPTDLSSIGFTNHYVMFLNGYPLATHLNFDGLDDYVEIPNGGGLNNLQQGTIETWVKWNGTQDQDGLVFGDPYFGAITARQSNNSFSNHIIALNGDNPNTAKIVWSPYSIGSAEITSSISPMDDTWVHLAITYQDGEHKLYVNGVLDGSSTTTGVISDNTNVPLTIGGWSGDGNCFSKSNIDEFRVWNVIRTADQINGSKNCELQGTETGLVAYYNFNQGNDASDNTSVITLTDATSNVNNGTLTNFALTGETSNFLSGSPVTTGSVIPSVATVTTPVTYNQGDTASALSATTGTNGSGLLWYTTVTGGTGSTAPTPSTATVGSTSYWVSSTNANGCESERIEIVVTVEGQLSTTNFEVANNIKMYPNPSKNFVTVEVNNLTSAKLQVVDITGKVLMNQSLNTSSNTIDISQLPTGLYFFKVASNEGMATSKIVKQ